MFFHGFLTYQTYFLCLHDTDCAYLRKKGQRFWEGSPTATAICETDYMRRQQTPANYDNPKFASLDQSLMGSPMRTRIWLNFTVSMVLAHMCMKQWTRRLAECLPTLPAVLCGTFKATTKAGSTYDLQIMTVLKSMDMVLHYSEAFKSLTAYDVFRPTSTSVCWHQEATSSPSSCTTLQLCCEIWSFAEVISLFLRPSNQLNLTPPKFFLILRIHRTIRM